MALSKHSLGLLLYPLFLLFLFELKGGGTVLLQYQAGIEFLSSLTDQAFEDGCPFRKNQIPDIVFREERATHFTEDMEIAPNFHPIG